MFLNLNQKWLQMLMLKIPTVVVKLALPLFAYILIRRDAIEYNLNIASYLALMRRNPSVTEWISLWYVPSSILMRCFPRNRLLDSGFMNKFKGIFKLIILLFINFRNASRLWYLIKNILIKFNYLFDWGKIVVS